MTLPTKTTNGDINEDSGLIGNGSSTQSSDTITKLRAYDSMIAGMIQSYTSASGNGIKVYLISFSLESSLYNHVRSIGTYAGAETTDVFAYSTSRDLGAIFETIREDNPQ